MDMNKILYLAVDTSNISAKLMALKKLGYHITISVLLVFLMYSQYIKSQAKPIFRQDILMDKN
jgi:hypothetical protein